MRRDDDRYGSLAQNPEGDEAFRKDRRAWYEHVTGESFEGVSLSEQWERVDVLARGWRAYSDGRACKQAADEACIECGRPWGECAGECMPASDDDAYAGYACDDY